MINLNDLFSGGNEGGGVVNDPRQLFSTLNRHERFVRPSDEQGEVLDGWFSRRDESDLTIKMNTGSGKTLVGLLILKSSLNDGIGPAVYLTPDNYLAKQVVDEAQDLGVAYTENENDPAFLRGDKILVVNARKLFNGRSVFGVRRVEIPIGSIVVDDAHACLDDIKDQFSLKIHASSPLYSKILSKMEDGLRQYNSILYTRVTSGDPGAVYEVPYWVFKDKRTDIADILIRCKSDVVSFSLPLIIDVLDLCQCAVSGRSIEIAPRYLPADIIPSFYNAKRKIYMTATLANDGILISHLQANPEAILTPIRPKGAGDIGVRMILAPLELNTDFTFEDLQLLAKEVARHQKCCGHNSLKRCRK